MPSSGIVTWKHFEQERFKSFVRTIEFVNEQDRRTRWIRCQRIEQRTLDQKLFREDVAHDSLAIGRSFSFGNTDRDHLRGVVPLVQGRSNVEAFVALEADQSAIQRSGENVGDLGFADTRLTLEEQRTGHTQRKKYNGRERAIGYVVVLAEQRERRFDRGRQRAPGFRVHEQLHNSAPPSGGADFLWDYIGLPGQGKRVSHPRRLQRDRFAAGHGGDRAACHHTYQMRPIGRVGVDVRHDALGCHFHPIK